jgi:phage tail-like protein
MEARIMAEAAAASTAAPIDPYRAYNFKLQIQGVTEGHFTEVSGMGVKVHAISYREGGVSQVVRRLPGRVEYADVTLRYGLTKSVELWNWFMTGMKGKVERRNVSVLMVDGDGTTEVMRWNLFNAWLSDWRAAALDAMGKEVAIETLTLVCESIERQ